MSEIKVLYKAKSTCLPSNEGFPARETTHRGVPQVSRIAVYVGNDVNDLECLQAVGCGVVVSDSHPDVFSAARIVLSSPGGRGAIRELAGLIFEQSDGSYETRMSAG